MDGIEIFSKMKRRGRQLPGIIFSANVSKKMAEPIGMSLEMRHDHARLVLCR